MINATTIFQAAKRNPINNITFVQLRGDEDFEWVIANHPDTPAGFVSIGGMNNGSFRIIEKSVFEAALNA